MSVMTALVARLVAAGAAAQEAALVVMEAIEHGINLSKPVTGRSRDILETRRENERLRKQKSRENRRKINQSAKANDVAVVVDLVTGRSRDNADTRSNSILSSSLSSSLFPEERGFQEISKKEKKKEVSARGTRITTDWIPSDADRKFALDRGADPDNLRLEFIDFWIAVPGQRGLKTDWSATWRNRVRQVAGGKNGQRSNQNRTYPGAKPAATNADAILAGMARVAEKRYGAQPTDQPGDGEVSGSDDAAGGPDADRYTTRSHSGSPPMLALTSRSDTIKR